MALPLPTPLAAAHSLLCRAYLMEHIEASDGWISFADFMDKALYAPGLGYYAAGAGKFGQAGDFVTAPMLTPLFAQTLAQQIAPVLENSAPYVLEAGAGTGQLAADLLCTLERLDALPTEYQILEISPDLRERQAAHLEKAVPHLVNRVRWLDQLPQRFSGLVLGNELLDALPAHRICWQGHEILEQGVSLERNAAETGFVWANRPATGPLLAAATQIANEAEERGAPLPLGYISEIGLAAMAWTKSWGNILEAGALLLFDYGFPAHEFYHPQRSEGTLMCHYRHHAHGDPFYAPGLQDITAHIDFTGLITAAFPEGLSLLGYTSQGQFLMNCGILPALEEMAHGDFGQASVLRSSAAVNQLILPQEMGELFKVMALGKGLDLPLVGFSRGDRSHRL